MNNWDRVLAFLVSIVLGLWGLFLYQVSIAFFASVWRFTALYFLLLIILLSISIVAE